MSIAALTYSFSDNTTPVNPPAPAGDPLDATTLNAIIAKINAIIAAGNTFVGTIIAFGGSTAPGGFLSCDGSAVSRTTYADLFTAISTTWGIGDGSTTFNLPDLRETALVGIGTRGGGVTAHDTYTIGQFKDDQFQGHYHDNAIQNTNASAGYTDPMNFLQGNGSVNGSPADAQIAGTPTTDGTNGTPRIGTTTHGKQAGVLYCIKY
jgi:microcystin-dependent protein